MTPVPQELAPKEANMNPNLSPGRLVISGMSGLYPQSANLKEFANTLYNKVDPITYKPKMWNYTHPELPEYVGQVPELEKFDAQFFKVYRRLGLCMDPTSRKLFEHTYQAIYDAGLSVEHLAGRNIGVFVGTSYSETEKATFININYANPSTMSGYSKSMYSNRISYWLDIKGPSSTVDDACCSSIIALEQACLAIARGDCEAAIVASCSSNMHPQTLISYGRNITLCPDGKTRSFDKDAKGCVKSGGGNVLFIQKAEDALRIYAEVVHVKSAYTLPGHGAERQNVSIHRTSEQLTHFLQNFYEDVDVTPQQIQYVEAFGAAIPELDKAELEAYDKVFCKDRSNPLLVGSVMSNIGYCESASGIASITKVLLAYETGLVAANLHCSNPRSDVPAVRDGRIHLVTEHQPISKSYAAVNNLSITGVNAHVLLRGYNKTKNLDRSTSSIPHLVAISGRQDSGVFKIFNDMKSRTLDPEELALLRHIHEKRITGHLARGYSILSSDEKNVATSIKEQVKSFDDVKRPVWFVYSGMGSQWVGMGSQLMRIPIFAAAIERCRKVLEPKGINIVDIITSNDKTTFDNILHSFVGIAAIQIGLTDILRVLNIEPDNIIGHSVGELGCGYGDGCLTAEEMILSAYSRGLVSSQTPFIKGSMAAVGIGYQKIVKLCPPEIEVACHNGPDSSTISGPAEAMSKFVSELKAQGIFAKEVPCSNIAYHSRYIAKAGPKLLEYLNEVIKTPKPRSSRWVSTSVPQEKWGDTEAQYCSAWYHTNNLLNPVLFEETSRLVPDNAIVIEIAPHGLLQAILKRSLSPDCCHVPLTDRGNADNAVFLLEAIGKLFMEGLCPKINVLYPEIEFPVSTGTPMLSHQIEWIHSETWGLPLYKNSDTRTAAIFDSVISIHDDEHSYLQGHVVNGKKLYPFSAALVAVWDTLAMSSRTPKKQFAVQFQDVHLFAQPPIHDLRTLKFSVDLHKGSGKFEVKTDYSRIATGYIKKLESDEEILLKMPLDEEEELFYDCNDVYNLLEKRSYSYKGEFRNIKKTNSTFTEAQLEWNDNWVTFIEGMMQLNILNRDHDSVSRPSHIHKLTIDPETHFNKPLKKHDGVDIKTMTANLNTIPRNYTRCGGVVIERIQFYDIHSHSQSNMIVSSLKSVPKYQSDVTEGAREGEYHLENIAVDNGIALQSGVVGDLSSLFWKEVPESSDAGILVKVQYFSINDIDAKRACGIIPFKQNCPDAHFYGMDFSGTTSSGERVMGIVETGAARAHLPATPELLWPVPAHWSLEDAATVPLAYAQAFYCLGINAKLYRGMTILVHGATGALGQAVIAIALAHNCQVYATVSSINKKNFLLKLYPALEGCIGNSRDHSFGDLVLQRTKGKGCDIIISCVTGALKNTTLKCLAHNGVMFDTIQSQIDDDYTYGLSYLAKQGTFVMVKFDEIFKHKEDLELLQAMVGEGISRGYVRPLSRITYATEDASRAFRLLAASRHCGRVLVRLQDCVIRAQPRLSFDPALTQLIICDKSGLGLDFTERLVARGAKNLHLVCPSLSEHFIHKIQSWQKRGVKITTSSDVIESEKCFEDLNNKISITYIEGVFVVDVIDNVTSIMSSLDLAFRKSCPSLKYFALISSNSLLEELVRLTKEEEQSPKPKFQLVSVSNPKEESEYEKVSVTRTLDALEYALRSSQRRVKVYPQKRPESSLLQEIYEVAGLASPDSADKNCSLKQLGFDNNLLSCVCSHLHNVHNVSLTEKQLSEFNIQKIQDLNDKLKEPRLDRKYGLAAYLSHIDSDEITATSKLVILSTLDKEATEENIHSEKQYLYIVPGLEGNHNRFKNMCEQLKLPAVVLQPGYDHPQETAQEMAQRLAQIIKKKTYLKDNFYLLGFEHGITTALELAAIFENEGLVGTVFCVGGTPEEIKNTFVENMRGFDTENELQDALLNHISTLMLGTETDGMKDKLRDISSWKDKCNFVVNHNLDESSHSIQFIQSFIETMYARCKGYSQNDWQIRPLKSRIIMVRSGSTARVTPDEELQRCSLQPVLQYTVRAPLELAAQDPRCAAIVNRHLSAEILQQFDTKSQCETYAVVSDVFTTYETNSS